jgi:hypothetical protein
MEAWSDAHHDVVNCTFFWHALSAETRTLQNVNAFKKRHSDPVPSYIALATFQTARGCLVFSFPTDACTWFVFYS